MRAPSVRPPHTTPFRVRRRAQAVLLCAESVSLHQIGERVDMNEHQVTLWRRRFIAERLDGLVDAPRPARGAHDGSVTTNG